MAIAWLTYAWADNNTGDVDFIAQELEHSGVQIKLDRWNVGAGKRLWEQIANFITNPALSDAWVLYATQNSLGSEACREEFACGLDRALHARGRAFPVIGLFPSPIDHDLIPAGIRTRLFVSTTDPDWKERIGAAVENRDPSIARRLIEPYEVKVHQRPTKPFPIEMRPRAGTWSPFFAAIPIADKDRARPYLSFGPSNARFSPGGVMTSFGDHASQDGRWWIYTGGNEATPTQSYYLWCEEVPTEVAFGILDGSPRYQVKLVPQATPTSFQASW